MSPSPAVSTLRFLAWLNLIGGIIAAIVIWVTMGSVEVKDFSPLTGRTLTETVRNPLGIWLGIGGLVESIFERSDAADKAT